MSDIKITYTGEKPKPKQPVLNLQGDDTKNVIWDPVKTPIKAYELAKAGMPDAHIAKAIGVSPPTFCIWVRNKPGLAYALERGRTSADRNGVATFVEYVYGRLTPELKGIWEEVVALNKRETDPKNPDPSASVFLKNLMEGQPRRNRQHLWVHAYVDSNFNASEACRATFVSKATLDAWMEETEFQKLIAELEWHMANLFEGCLVDLVVKEKDPSATIFVAKTKLRDRGYNDKVEMQVSHDHKHTHLHAAVQVDSLDLSIEVRKAMLEAVRKQKAPPPRVVQALPAHEDK